MIKRILPWGLIPLAILSGASLVKLNQLRAPIGNSLSLLYTDTNGTVRQGKLAGMAVDAGGNITLPFNGASAPSITVTHVSNNQANSFPIPAGKTTCFVSNNIPQALNEDYTIINGAVIFNNPPVLDDIVQLLCF